jgi:hypothetical protein
VRHIVGTWLASAGGFVALDAILFGVQWVVEALI